MADAYVLQWSPATEQGRPVTVKSHTGTFVAHATVSPSSSVEQVVADLRKIGAIPSEMDVTHEGLDLDKQT